MKAKLHILTILILGLGTPLFSQDLSVDTLPRPSKEDFLLAQDSTKKIPDSLKVSPRKFIVSKDSLDAPVETFAEDSMIYDIKNKQMHLYGNASVTYTSINLKADYIVLDYESNTVTASPLKDSLGRLSGIPEFSDGGENFTAKGIKYNFKTKKGIITDATSTQNDLYVLSSKGKFVAGDPTDSLRKDDVIYSKDAIFTSCNLDHPHYGIRSNKQKVVPGKTVVVGPSNLEIGGVPTPLWLPFGFFPISTTAKAGLIIPRDYEYDPRYGFGISQIGYFTPLGEHANLQLTGDFYLKKRWGFHVRSQFKKIHKYSGVFSFDYGSLPTEIDAEIFRDNNYRFYLKIDQDRSAHPTMKFGGNIDFQKGNYSRRFRNDYNSVVNNQIGSRLNFSYNPVGRPWNMSASFNSNQNTQQQSTTINFPNLDFNMRRLYPFKKKVPGSKEQWYEKIGISYKANAKNRYVATDSTLFQGNWWQTMEYGAQQSADVNTTLNFLKYFRITPNAKASNTAYFKERQITFDETLQFDTLGFEYNDPLDSTDRTYLLDTIFGQQFEDTLNNFTLYQQYSVGASLGFDIFNTLQFKKGKIRGIRHIMKPSLSYNWSPNFRDTTSGNNEWYDFDYIRAARFDTRYAVDSLREYSKFLRNGVYGSPNPRGEQSSIGFGISNVVQAKYRTMKDSVVEMKYLNIIDEFALNGSYNEAIKSKDYNTNTRILPMSTINFRLRSNLFKNFTSIIISGSLDPYQSDSTGRRTNEWVWNASKRSNRENDTIRNYKIRVPFEFRNASLPINNRLTIKQIRNWISGVNDPEDNLDIDEPRNSNKKANVKEGGGFWDLFDNWSINHNIVLGLNRIPTFDEEGLYNGIKDTFQIRTNSIRIRGDLQLTPAWKITIDNLSYDFTKKTLVYPSLRFYRDLHCWEMGLNWQPAFQRYSFFLRVKPGTLGFIEVPYKQQNFSGFN